MKCCTSPITGSIFLNGVVMWLWDTCCQVSDYQGRTLRCARSSMELGLPKVWASKKNLQPSSTTKYYPTKKNFILFLSDTTCSITITSSDFPFILPRLDFLFLFCCLDLGLLELGILAFGVRCQAYQNRVVIFTFVTFLTLCPSHAPCINYQKALRKTNSGNGKQFPDYM